MNKLLCVFFVAVFCLVGFVPEAVKAEEQTEQIYLTTVMYHSVVENATGIYKISPEKFEKDLIAYEKAGYTIISANQLVAYSKELCSLPKKPLLITFDDGHYNNLYYAYPILLKHNATAVVNVIGKFSEYATKHTEDRSPYYSYLTWEDIKYLSDQGIEIGNHTYNMHDFKPRFGIKQKAEESAENYKSALEKDFSRLDKKLVSSIEQPVNVFAYPFGLYNKTAESILKEMGYKITLTCNEKHSKIRKGHPEDLYLLGRYNRDGRLSTAEFLKRIET